MKKLILTTVIAFAVLFVHPFGANAQLKVFSGTPAKVAIGSTTAPNQSLDVTGDISLVGTTKAYRINNNYVLWNNGKTGCIYVGTAGSSGNTGTNNTFVGYTAGASNTTGYNSTFLGYRAGYYTVGGWRNTFTGVQAGYYNSSGNYCSFYGVSAGQGNTTGSGNTAMGDNAGITNTTGSNNTCIGYGANVGAAGAIERGAFGYNAVNSQADYTIWMGNSTTKNIWVAAGGNYNISDGRFKFNVKEEVKGLEFINKLRPVTYQVDTKKMDDFQIQDMPDSIKTLHQQGMNFTPSTAIVHSGFIAQEVDKAAKSCGSISSIVSTPDDSTKSFYGLGYVEIVVPLVKAVQELSNTVDSLKSVVANCCPKGAVQRSNESGSEDQGKAPSVHELELANNCTLFQNFPNPFGEGTSIKYFIPDNISNAQIIFLDEFGNKLKEFKVEEKGMGQLNITATNLASGVYNYSLVVNGKVVATKQMIKNK